MRIESAPKKAAVSEPLFPQGATVTAQVETPLATTTELATITQTYTIVPSEFFKPGGSAEILSQFKAMVRAKAARLDISTETGRTAIASLAYNVARSKTALDDQGDKLIEETRKLVTAVNGERKVMRDDMDAFKIEIRKPLTDWENLEKARVAGHENALKDM